MVARAALSGHATRARSLGNTPKPICWARSLDTPQVTWEAHALSWTVHRLAFAKSQAYPVFKPQGPRGGMVDTGDLKSLGRIGRAGSSPAAGTKQGDETFDPTPPWMWSSKTGLFCQEAAGSRQPVNLALAAKTGPLFGCKGATGFLSSGLIFCPKMQ